MTIVSLSALLRERTRDAHAAAERAGIMVPLLRRTLSRAGYRTLLLNLLPIYEALEHALADPATPAPVRALALPGLARAERLRADIAGTDRWVDDGAPTRALPESIAYATHLQVLRQRAPLGLAAHAYLRYLGDLSGGQVLARIVRSAWGDDAPVALYGFGDADVHARLASGFRQALDAVARTAAEAEPVVAEALDGFERHRRLFMALEFEQTGLASVPTETALAATAPRT